MPHLKIFNSFNKKKEIFKPINPGKVGIYVCGVTVYDYCHIGHGRMFVNFDIIRRWFMHSGYEVNFVQNITDVDDKIIKRALSSQKSIPLLTNYFIQTLLDDIDQLNVLRPTHQPKASEYIQEMQNLIHKLILKNYAYQSNNGDINYAVRQFCQYGRLSGKNLNDLQINKDVVNQSGKREHLDFVLWKKTKIGEPKEAIWTSPWGDGRPGWHIECSAMSQALLGNHFDIHGGGQDLKFPHHENEIAQSEAANNSKFVNYWMHNGHIKIQDQKMSKSVGNFVFLRELLRKYDGEVIRFYLISAHYRSPLEFNENSLVKAKSALTRLYLAIKDTGNSNHQQTNEQSSLTQKNVTLYRNLFYDAMNDDFNTPKAISILFTLANEIFRNSDSILINCLIELANLLGLLKHKPIDFLQSKNNDHNKFSKKEIEEMIQTRLRAKECKDFETADAIRDKLLNNNIILEDSLGKTQWRKL